MTSLPHEAAPKAKPSDERLRQENRLRRLLRRPELGAAAGALAVFLFFAFAAGGKGFLSVKGTANYLQVAAELGILAIAVSLLMIGGEFDLSIGSMMGAAGMITAILINPEYMNRIGIPYGINLWVAMVISLLICVTLGAINGLLVVYTRLPSFIITLGSLFVIRGATIGLTRAITQVTQVRGIKEVMGYDSAAAIFASKFRIADGQFPISIVWWLLFAALATYLLLNTRPGNWIYGMGGDEKAARNMGVPVSRMKIILFMTTAAAAWFVATIQVIGVGSADVLRGEQREFFAIIASVIGGTLLTGGYGSAIGAVLGALIVGMVQQGIVFTGTDSDWFLVFLGAMLIIAVLINNFIRKQASEAK